MKTFTIKTLLLVVMFISVVGSLASATFVKADTSNGDYTVLEPLPCISGGSVKCQVEGQLQTTVNVRGYVQYMFNLFIAISAVTAVLVIIFGGFTYMTSDAIQGKKEGREKIFGALKGLLLVLCSFLLLRTIDPRFTQIPENLVTSLGNTAVSGTGEFSNYSSALSNSFNQSAEALRKEYVDVTKQMSDNNSQISSLESQKLALLENGDCEDESCDQIKALDSKISDIQSKNNILNSDITYKRAMKSMDGWANCNQTIKGGVDCSKSLAAIEQAYNDNVSSLQPDQMEQLSQYKDYSETSFSIMQQAGIVYDKSTWASLAPAAFAEQKTISINKINQIVKAYEESGNVDETLLAKAKADQQRVIGQINAMKLRQ